MRAAAGFLVLFLGITSVSAAVPRVDASFGTGGSVRTLVGATTESASGVALMGDGRVVIAGNVQTQVAGAGDLVTTVPAVGVVRLLADGTRDAAFGVNGQVVVQVPDVANGKLVATDVAVQADGKVVVLISRNNFVTPDAAPVLMRLTPAGTLDTAFGNGGFLSVTGIFAKAMVVQPDDKIVLGGSAKLTPESTESFALARYDAAGNADAAFGTMGVAIMNPAYGEGRAYAIAVAADGRLAVAGQLVGEFAVGLFTASGSADTTFAGIGVVVTPTNQWASVARGVTFQADGKIVATGASSPGPGTPPEPGSAMVARYRADGYLDTGFGNNGYKLYPAGTPMATHPQFRASDATITVNLSQSLMRVTGNGAVDTTFGSNGLVTPPFTFEVSSYIYTTFSALVARPDGRLIPVGAREGGFAVTTYLADGTPDASFAVAPTEAVQLDTGSPIAFQAIAPHADGRIVAAGTGFDGRRYICLATFTAGGAPDASFDVDGRMISRAFGTRGSVQAIIPLVDGKVVVAGSSLKTNNVLEGELLTLARFDASGALDPTFGTSGITKISAATGSAVLSAAARQSDGRIVVTGTGYGGMAYLARVTADGMPDATFGTNGLVTAPMSASFNAVTILGDGKILVAGSTVGSNRDLLLVRFTAAGAIDATFGNGGMVQADLGALWGDYGIAMAVLDNGRILVGGVSNAATGEWPGLAVARFLADGSLDTTFGVLGKSYVAPGVSGDFRVSMAVLSDGRILLAGNTQTGTISMASLNADGTPTARFGTAGLATLPSSSELPLQNLRSITVLPDGKVVIASTSNGGAGRITRLLVSPTTRGDASGDARADLFWRDAASGFAWWTMDGAATLGSNFFDVGAEWQVADVADLDGDGKADLLWRHTGTGALYAWRLDGLVPAGYWDLGVPDAGWSPVGAADLDGNGTADILFRHADGSLYAWLMQGATIASHGAIGTAPADSAIADLADVNGDGKTDIVWRRTTDGEVFYWLMNGLASLGGESMGTVDPALWTLIAADDFNGDGKADLLWRATTGEAYVWLMNGKTVLSTGSLGNPGGAWSIRAVADFTGDGKADLLWRHTDGSGYLWTLSGTTITAGVPVANPGGSWQVVHP
jgi:uncharacterized delta-60 repeat protein